MNTLDSNFYVDRAVLKIKYYGNKIYKIVGIHSKDKLIVPIFRRDDYFFNDNLAVIYPRIKNLKPNQVGTYSIKYQVLNKWEDNINAPYISVCDMKTLKKSKNLKRKYIKKGVLETHLQSLENYWNNFNNTNRPYVLHSSNVDNYIPELGIVCMTAKYQPPSSINHIHLDIDG